VLISIAGCKGPALFKLDIAAGQAPLTVTFTNQSKNADEFQWDFGDGAIKTTTSAKEPVVHQYTKAGAHTVTLKAVKHSDPPETSTFTAIVTVQPGAFAQVAIDPAEATLAPGQGQAFSAQAQDQFGNLIPGLTVTFGAAEEAGQIDSTGMFTATTKAGSYEKAVTATATQEGMTRQAGANIIVVPGPLDHVLVSPNPVELNIGQSQGFTAMAVDAYDNPISGAQLTLEIADGVGTLSDHTITTGTQAGTFDRGLMVTASKDGLSVTGAASITVNPDPLAAIAISPIEVRAGHTIQLEATPADRYGNRIPGLQLT
jgi:PKD repeat protein